MAASAAVRAAAQYFVERGGVVIASAGNTAAQEGIAETPWILSVSATDENDALAGFSSWGSYVDLAAPGVGIRTTLNGGGYGSVQGTSYSAPVVAGVAALMLRANPNLTPSELETLLELTAEDLGDAGWDARFGYGRVNAASAVLAAAMLGAGPLPCADGVDNDGDGLHDYPADPQCTSPLGASARAAACGLGFELALLLPVMLRAWRSTSR